MLNSLLRIVRFVFTKLVLPHYCSTKPGKWAVIYLWVIDVAYVSKILLFDSVAGPTVWFFFSCFIYVGVYLVFVNLYNVSIIMLIIIMT